MLLSGGTLAISEAGGTFGDAPSAAAAHWAFDDGTGSATADDSVSTHDGTLMNMDPGTAWVTGRSGEAGDYALLFDGSLALRSTDDYTLDVAGPLSGPGGVSVSEGNVNLSGGGAAGSMAVTGGMVNLSAELELQTLSVTGGAVDTGTSQVIVADRMVLGNTPFIIHGGNIFAVNGTDLGNPSVDRLITVSGGTLELGASSIPVVGLASHWSLDDGPGSPTAADLAGGRDGNLVNMDLDNAWVAGHPPAADDYALAFDGADDRIDVPYAPALNPDSFTATAWVNPNSTAGYQSVFTSRNDVGPNTELEGFILYNDSGGNWSFWTGDGDPGWPE